MFKPSAEKSEATRQLVASIFANRVPNGSKYTVAYAYYMKSGLFGKKVFNYVIGFSAEDQEIVIIPTDSDGNSSEAVLLQRSHIASAKRGLQGDTKIKTTDGATYQFVVPPYTPAALEAAYILPVVQEDEATRFMAFIKQSF